MAEDREGLEELIVLCSGRQISWQPSTGGRGRAGRGRRRNTTGLDKIIFETSTSWIAIMMVVILIPHLRQLMLAKFAEDDKLDQMNAQRRRMK